MCVCVFCVSVKSPLHAGSEEDRNNAGIHPCLEWDLNQQLQFPCSDKRYTP